ncbi:PLP-dependent aminotransferase family protein [Arthrobacter psychrochitiniphilus]|uniref:Aminotransferase n=1 Tax=Arthrobacter psychrochitiniphilus TaxID=291045 RepID=A0A2V3DU56_9MICC|nr:PLP-dependent aminotransferase family protein [Arthrobacter psychrochitiniphilus]NYG15536.1 DNA-binding transcriptional MocR family regulator [Arthrobacter psychrochitiniphilus]PXA66965.1 aminotransferase [Arthrobacter psychrochitiniphilus]
MNTSASDAYAAETLSEEAVDALTRASASTLPPGAHRHEALLSARAANIKQSAVRDVFEISMQPGLVSLAGGNPYLQSLPLDRLAASASAIIATHGLEALQYGGGQGTLELRTQICQVMAAEGILDADPENVVITAGSQSAQDVAAKVFCDPGDVILIEDPTYVGALNTFEAYEVDVQPVIGDEHGIVPALLRERIAALQAEGKRIKLLYTIPNFNNPSGVMLARERRQEIVDICRKANILVLEDNPYGLLKFDGVLPEPLRAANAEDVLYLGSFSKIFAPGLRIGWALVPAHLKQRFYLASEAVTLCPPTFNQMLVSDYLNNYDWQGQVSTYRALYQERCTALLQALAEFMPDTVSWTKPEGGFFVWLSLPEGIDTYPLLHKGIDAGVVFVPGAAFSPQQGPSNKLRLAFSAVPPETLREGVKRLAPVLAEAIAGV